MNFTTFDRLDHGVPALPETFPPGTLFAGVEGASHQIATPRRLLGMGSLSAPALPSKVLRLERHPGI